MSGGDGRRSPGSDGTRWWGRALPLVLLAVVVGLIVAPETAPVRALRLAAFDTYQSVAPRTRVSAPVVIVAIDETSLDRHGQWPWPRTVLARLVRTVAEGGPAAIGIDIVMAEPDRLSPDHLLRLLPTLEPDVAARLERLPRHDAVLAAALRGLPVALGVAGVDDAVVGVAGPLTPVRARGGDPLPFVRRFAGLLRSVPEIDAAAAGHGLINPDRGSGIVRRLPVVAAVGGTLAPALGVELLRLATGEPAYTVHLAAHGIRHVAVGAVAVRTEADGAAWIHYTPHDPSRFVSAADVLEGRVDPGVFDRKLVLVGVTALGLGDHHATPVGGRMSGVEIHAQFLENVFDGQSLMRPPWAEWAEAGLLLGGGLLLIAFGPAWSVRSAVVVGLAVLTGVTLVGVLAYRGLQLLLDVALPGLGLVAIFAALMATTLAQAQAQRRTLRKLLAAEREAAARVAGELEAARRIQMGTLPRVADVVAGDERLAVHATVEPARTVGGDFYDAFRLDGDRLFFCVGDVSGNGVPGSLFMAVSKALCKTAALRCRGDLAATMQEASGAIARDNAEALFVTVWAGVLDLQTGRLEYCNAGHEPAWLVAPATAPPRCLADGGGPPLGLDSSFRYAIGSEQLRKGDVLCVLTDGVTEASGPGGRLYGRARLHQLLQHVPPGTGGEDLAREIRQDVARFAAGIEPEDDITMLVVTWNPPRQRSVSAP